MTTLYPSATLTHLRQRHRLDATLVRLGDAALSLDGIATLARAKQGIDDAHIAQSSIDALRHHGLVQSYPRTNSNTLPFYFVEAINVEVSYFCNLACAHCLQEGFRPQQAEWIDHTHFTRVLEDAQWLDLVSHGINITGGEAFLPNSPVLNMIATAQRLNISSRANTNGWWGNGRHIVIGDTKFKDDQAVIDTLCGLNLGILALSLDNRYIQYPALLERVIRVAYLCEQAKLNYEFVATEPNREISNTVRLSLAQQLGRAPRYMSLSQMEKVDLGAAKTHTDQLLNAKELLPMVKNSACQGKGFYRPYYLHLAPNGDLRSCLYAPNSGWIGNVQTSALAEILNGFEDNAVYQMFQDDALENFIETYMTPWQHLYQHIDHNCTASAVVARVIDAVTRLQQHSDKLTPQQLQDLHLTLARQYALAA